MTTFHGSNSSAASSPDVTRLLIGWGEGDHGVSEQLFSAVYAELHHQAARAMRRESDEVTLQATVLVSEAYLRLIDQSRVQWRNRAHFFGVAAQLMRRILVDHRRGRLAGKGGGGGSRAAGSVSTPSTTLPPPARRLTTTASTCSRSTRRSSAWPSSIPAR